MGDEGEEVDESWADGILELNGLSVESIAAAVIARRYEETGVDDPEARVETLWAVRRAVARTLTGKGAQERTLRQLLHSPGAGRSDLRPGLRAGAG